MTWNINYATYDQKTDQTTFDVSLVFDVKSEYCGMEDDFTQCEPIMRSSLDKSRKPAIG